MTRAVAPRPRGRGAARGPRHHRRRRPQERRARALRRAVLRARQPLPAPGRPARRGLDRERPAALPVARLRLLPARRLLARLRGRGDHLPARDPRRRGVRRRRGGAARHDRHRPDGRDDGQLGRRARLRHGRALQPRPRRRAAPPGGGRQAHLHRHPPRGRRGVRGVRLRQAHRPPRGVPDDRRPRRHQPAHRAVGREGRPRAGPRAHRPGRHAGARPRRVPGGRPVGRVRLGRRVEPARAARLQPGRADEPRVQERAAAPRRRAPDLPRRGADAAGARGRGGRRARRPRRRRRRSRRRDESIEDALRLLRGCAAAGDRSSATAPASTCRRSPRSPSSSARR